MFNFPHTRKLENSYPLCNGSIESQGDCLAFSCQIVEVARRLGSGLLSEQVQDFLVGTIMGDAVCQSFSPGDDYRRWAYSLKFSLEKPTALHSL